VDHQGYEAITIVVTTTIAMMRCIYIYILHIMGFDGFITSEMMMMMMMMMIMIVVVVMVKVM